MRVAEFLGRMLALRLLPVTLNLMENLCPGLSLLLLLLGLVLGERTVEMLMPLIQ